LAPGPYCKEGGHNSPSWRAWLKYLCGPRWEAARCRAGKPRL
jgi:hypothetical protein